VSSLYADECSFQASPVVPVYGNEYAVQQVPVVPVYGNECAVHGAHVVPLNANDYYVPNAYVKNVIVKDCREGLYASAFGGINFLQVHKDSKKKTGYVGGIALGYKLNNSVRLEAEVAYRRNKIKTSFEDKKVHVAYETYSVMANLYYDFNIGSDLTPYLGAGVGYANNRNDLHKKGKDYSQKQGLVYQGIAGIDYKICNKTYVGLEYRYLAPQKHRHDHAGLMSVKRYF
jgi:opacity protein-like surface antigen